jgi:hypothetical protein
MVTVRLKIREGFLGGTEVEVSVTRPSLARALGAVTAELVGRRALKVADLWPAVRRERAGQIAASREPYGRLPGDPMGLTRIQVSERRWGFDLSGLTQAFERAGVALREALSGLSEADRRRADDALRQAPIVIPRPTAIDPIPPLDLGAFRQNLPPK